MKIKVSFEAWMRSVDLSISTLTGGLTSADLSDMPYSDWFEDGLTSDRAAKRAVRNEKRGLID